MAKYKYRGVDSNGKVKTGTVEANAEDAAKSRLRAEGINITEFSEQNSI